MGYESPTNGELLTNSIAFFIPSLLFFLGRIVNGAFIMQRLQIDDYLMMFFFFIYASLLILINASARFATNLFPAEQLDAILADPDDVASRIIGSKIVIPLEQCMLLSTWGVKVCLLIFLHRMTHQMPKTRAALYFMAAYIFIGYLVIQVCYYAILCTPFRQYYALPVVNSECATYTNYSKIQMVFNISSDLFIIILPVSILWRSKLPMKRKFVLMGLFSLGLFTILSAILNKYYNFASPETTIYQLWYIREASVAMWVGNIICCWQLLQYFFKIRSFDNEDSGIPDQNRMPDNKSAGGHTMNSSWWRSKIAFAKNAPQPDPENSNRAINEKGGDGSEANTGNIIIQPTTLCSIVRDNDDARPALQYRASHLIE